MVDDQGWIDAMRGRTRRERRADMPVPATLTLLDKQQHDLLCRWVRGDAIRRKRGTLVKDAGPRGIELADALCKRLLNEGWIILCERLAGGTWHWDALVWRDLPRLQELMDVTGPHRRAEIHRALVDQAQDWLRNWCATATEPDPDLLDELKQAQAQLTKDRSQSTDRLTRRLNLLRTIAAWHDADESGTRRDFALCAGGDTKALSDADWRWLESSFDLERLRIARFTLVAWLAGDLTLHWDGPHTVPLGHLHCISLPLDDLLQVTAATAPQRWWLIENRASFERQARDLEPGTTLLWMPGRPSTAWRAAVTHLLRLAPAPAWISADADPSGVDIACSVGTIWESQGLAWTPHRMGIAEWTATCQTWPLNEHDRRMLDRLLSRPGLPAGLHTLCESMRIEGRKAEQEAWL